MTPQHARPPAARLGAWFWFGAVLAVAGAAVLAAGLVVGTAPLVPAALPGWSRTHHGRRCSR